MDYTLVPDKEFPQEINDLFAVLGQKMGLIASGIVLSGKYAPEFYSLLLGHLNDAARYMKDTLENGGGDKARPITKDDVLDMHRFLRDFDGDLEEE